ncbi:uncharacterized protein LOC132561532 [Ylistrum balloti]|uniref:uncharacterized protein LOC132561532 n=1 Tax=Ylistrum balloti TaxID=509963 RepID=UPI0029058C8B|nr:uncharacterized protein LOC132561532 [Ylistrum balloti]
MDIGEKWYGDMIQAKNATQMPYRLERIRSKFERRGITGIKFMIVNMNLDEARQQVQNLKNVVNEVEIPIYQDNDELQIWRTLGGDKDYLYIYDGCGMHRYLLTSADILDRVQSSIDRRLIKRRIRQVKRRDRCARQCRRYRRRLMSAEDMDRMQGHQPHVISMSRQRNSDSDANRTPACMERNCRGQNNPQSRHRLIHRM